MEYEKNSTPSTRAPSPASTPLVSTLRVNKNLIEPVLEHPSRIRNVCILAHVDHGKTTLTDTLLASNGIISFKQAGKLRYLDSREDEQIRGITMESSAITLLYDSPRSPGNIERHAINLIDSPGHVDFSRQVVSAARLCDGCLVLVDAVEGVCTQTISVLRQAKRESLKPCLVINKIDRLITELKLNTIDAATWLFRLLEQVNAINATLKSNFDINNDGDSANLNWEGGVDDDIVEFDPIKGNAIFCSSTDGWAFSTEHFVQLFSRKLEIKPEILRKCIWGEYFFDPKTKKVLTKKGAEAAGLTKNMFAQFCLDAIWTVYDCTVVNWSEEKIEKIIKQIGIKTPIKEVKVKDGKGVVKGLMGQWLPLADTVFSTIVEHCPSPLESNRVRLSSIFKNIDKLSPISKDIVSKLASPDSQSSDPMVAFVSKMLTIDVIRNRSCQTLSKPASAESLIPSLDNLQLNSATCTQKLIGMARMFHGSITVGQKIYIFGQNHNPPKSPHFTEHVVEELYLLMGRDFEPVSCVRAGMVFGIGGIDGYMSKQATLSSTLDCPLLDLPRGEIAPILRVAIRPDKLEHLSDVISGLKFLCQADPCAETFTQEENGEHILATAGELHLEQCVKDLQEKYTNSETEIIVSPPMVPYRETITREKGRNEELWKVHVGFDDQVNEEDGTIILSFADGKCKVGARALPIPKEIIQFLSRNKSDLRNVLNGDLNIDGVDATTLSSEFDKICTSQEESPWNDIRSSQLWSIGSRRDCSNILLSNVNFGDSNTPFFLSDDLLQTYESSILTGFQLICEKGPLTNEPLMGVAFILEHFELVDIPDDEDEKCFTQSLISSQLISLSRNLFEAAMLYWSPRLMLAVYHCSIQTTSETIGKVYSTLSKRHGRVISEEYHDGTGFFTVNSYLPVVESFGFADDIRGRTAGMAIPQLIFSGFETLDEDPYWIPSSEEEMEEHGQANGYQENRAMKYLISIRERKGLFVERKIVQFAEKQRTLKK